MTTVSIEQALSIRSRFKAGRLIFALAGSLASIAILAYLLDVSQLQIAIERVPKQPGTVLLAAVAYTAAFWLRAVAWGWLLASPPGAGRLFSILQTSLFLNHLLPFKPGELARPYLAIRHGIGGAEAVSTALVARLTDFAALALIACLALPAIGGSRELNAGLQVAALMIFVAASALLLLRWKTPAFLPEPLRATLVPIQLALREMRGGRLLLTLPVVIVSWLLESAVLLAAARLLGVELAVTDAMGATAFTVLFQLVHLTPGGLGVYEASMTSILVLQGVPAEAALTLAVVTHGLKFAYSFSVGLTFAASEMVAIVKGKAADGPKHASQFEIVSARLWNVINEGKPFTPVFTLTLVFLLSLLHATDASYWPRATLALLALTPLFVIFFRFDFPLKLRGALWVYLAAFLALFRFIDLTAVVLTVALYLLFTVFAWGTVYYHLRIGTKWTNFLRFWRLVLENPDPTSGNLQEQVPKVLILLLAFEYLTDASSAGAYLAIEGFILAIGFSAVLVHQWSFTWVPALPQRGYERSGRKPQRRARRFIAIVIDGCRADRLNEANTPFIDSVRRIGTDFTDVSTVYPARTVTCFSSMLTGAPASVHGMHSNFVPSLGVKCDSVFTALRREGLSGKLVGIAHLIDAFGHDDVRSVTAVMHNDEIDDALVARAKQVMEEESPDLLVLQLLSVDQTGHARGSYNDEYLRKIEITDGIIERFLGWCDEEGYLEDTTLLLTADHGQGIGIGGHGHMSPPEIRVPCIVWGKGVEAGAVVNEPHFVTDIAATICEQLGVPQPQESVGRSLLPASATADAPKPVVFIIPAFNEAASLPGVLASVAAAGVSDTKVVVVDDGSFDATSDVAAAHGAIVVRHETNRGLGAALRTGLAVARDLDARAAVYLDADGEYDARETARLLTPIEAGEADYVLGSRFKGRIEGMTPARRLANRVFSLLVSGLCGHRLSDGQTGFRAFSRRALDVAEIIHDYNYAQVLTLDLLHKRMRLREVPISYRRRKSGRSFVSAQYLWRVPVGIAREMLNPW